ncbi:MAG: hypothetical protein GY711_16315 [bacterium]|nr:hypothetical protein [bacterium]
MRVPGSWMALGSWVALLALGCTSTAPRALEPELTNEPTEADYYDLVSYATPENLVLEVSAVAMLPDGRPMLATRRGEVYIVEGVFDGGELTYKLFADGLQEPLGLLVEDDGWIVVGQRGELSRMRDTDGDDHIDVLETICDDWNLSGNYHEYCFGPRKDADGNYWLTLNKPFGGEPFGKVKWRGFAVRITPRGEFLPTVAGLRSPCGVETSPWGDLFYTDNQGEWCGASKLSHLVPGTFQGHPHGIDSCNDPAWPYEHPGEIPDGKLMPVAAQEIPNFQLPAVWFPYDKMGRSPGGFVWDTTEGRFGPFAGQVFVTDQYHAWVHRVTLENVDGHWQGACYPFRTGLESGSIRAAWAPDGSLLVGETNRGWGSKGIRTFGFERLVWTGKTPFEIETMRATPDGFELVFTRPADPLTLVDLAAYRLESYTYKLHSSYGSPEVERAEPVVVAAEVVDDGRGVRLVVDGLRAGYVHELHADGIRSVAGWPLLHADAYYTLIKRPALTP